MNLKEIYEEISEMLHQVNDEKILIIVMLFLQKILRRGQEEG